MYPRQYSRLFRVESGCNALYTISTSSPEVFSSRTTVKSSSDTRKLVMIASRLSGKETGEPSVNRLESGKKMQEEIRQRTSFELALGMPAMASDWCSLTTLKR